MGGYCDIETEIIVGCDEGSKHWYHEKGHIEYNKSEEGIKNSYKMTFSFHIAVILIIVSQLSIMNNFLEKLFEWSAVCFIGIFLWYFFYEESWCNDYADKILSGEEIQFEGDFRDNKELDEKLESYESGDKII